MDLPLKTESTKDWKFNRSSREAHAQSMIDCIQAYWRDLGIRPPQMKAELVRRSSAADKRNRKAVIAVKSNMVEGFPPAMFKLQPYGGM